jgi:hypothetical protein
MMPVGSLVPFTSFTTLLHVEVVLRLQVPATNPTVFDTCPSNAGGCCPFVSVDGQIMLSVLVRLHFAQLLLQIW